jgi:hypothetical protein
VNEGSAKRDSDNAEELGRKCFDTPEAMLPTLLNYCALIAARFRPRLRREDFKEIVDADRAATHRDESARRSLRRLGVALEHFQRDSQVPIDIRESGALMRSAYADVMRDISGDVDHLATELAAAVRRACGTEEGNLAPARLWRPLALTVRQAVIVRFTMVEGTTRHLEPWMDGPTPSTRDLAAVSFLAGSEPGSFSSGSSVSWVLSREVSAIDEALNALEEHRRFRIAR